MKRKIAFLLILFVVSLNCSTTAFRRFEALDRRDIADVLASWIFRNKCMGELGCFYNGPPFFDIQERPLSFQPSDRESINTRFLLHTRTNPENPQNFTNLRRSSEELRHSAYRHNAPVKFIVPGFISAWAPDWENPLKDILLKEKDGNVFIVDWTGGNGPLYEQAVSNTRVVGAEIAVFIQFLQNTTRIEATNIHIIGHSLGAHIAGYAGKRIKNLGRITGLDPAGPFFENVDPQVRLDYKDARFVDVIHTNGANSRFTGFGTTESIGDLDFFPNGGRSQPGCPNLGNVILSFLKNPSLKAERLYDVMCNHHRAIELFISSLSEKECDMIGVMCDSWSDFLEMKCGSCYDTPSRCAIMGYDAAKSWRLTARQRSNIYLNTTASPPYCREMCFAQCMTK